mgnify:CR=1 FL=1
MIDINNIPAPELVEDVSFEKSKEKIIAAIREIIPDYNPLESDKYMPLIEAVAYREMLLGTRINEAMKAVLLPTSTGANLDNVVSMYGIQRNKGARPRAEVEISLTTELDYDVLLPAGTVLTDRKREHFARVIESVAIEAKQKTESAEAKPKSVTAIIELEEHVVDSDARTEIFATPLPFVAKAKQKDDFMGGGEPESDENFRRRAVQSLERFSTAGAEESYIYHALSASEYVSDVYVDSITPGRVRVLLKLSGGNRDEIVDIVDKRLSSKDVRPLTEFVDVDTAEFEEVAVKAELELHSLAEATAVVTKIRNFFKEKEWAMGEHLNLSYLYKCLHEAGVYRVNLISPNEDILTEPSKYIKINLELTTKAVES